MFKPRSMRLSRKMPLFVAGVCAIMALGLGSLTYATIRVEQIAQNEAALMVAADLRTANMQEWIDDVGTETLLLAHNPSISSAMATFQAAWGKIEGTPQLYLQNAYVARNPNPAGQRDRLDRAEDLNDYNTIHAQHHPFLREVQQRSDFYDIFLINLNGDVVYSVFKEADLGANLKSGPLAVSGLADAYHQALEGETTTACFSDFQPYEPSAGAVAGFAASAITDSGGRVIGVIAVQLNMNLFNSVLSNPTGLGETGQIYAVAQDLTMRSNSRFEEGLKVLDKVAPEPHIVAALEGEDAIISEAVGMMGQTVMVNANPFSFGTTRWAIVAEADLSEVMSTVNLLRNKLALASIFAAAVISFAGWVYVRTVTNAIERVRSVMTEMSEGTYAVEVVDAKRADEIGDIGDIGKALVDFRNKLAAAHLADQDRAQKQREQEKVVYALSTGLVNLSEGNLTLPITEAFEPEDEKLRLDFNKTLTTLNAQFPRSSSPRAASSMVPSKSARRQTTSRTALKIKRQRWRKRLPHWTS